jgi:hypothetical protein
MDHDFDITFGSILEEDDEFLRRYNTVTLKIIWFVNKNFYFSVLSILVKELSICNQDKYCKSCKGISSFWCMFW